MQNITNSFAHSALYFSRSEAGCERVRRPLYFDSRSCSSHDV